MKFDHQAIQRAQREAFALLTTGFQEVVRPDGQREKLKNKFAVKPENITAPASLVQEVAYNNQTNSFSFDFSINGQPAGATAPTTNNVILGKNNVAVIFGLKILIGEGAIPASRLYRSRGITSNDDSIYNSIVNVKFEQSTLVDKMEGQGFRDVYTSPYEMDSNAGLVLWQPLRIVTGELGVFMVNINVLGTLNGIVLSSNLFLSVRPLIVFGQASATR